APTGTPVHAAARPGTSTTAATPPVSPQQHTTHGRTATGTRARRTRSRRSYANSAARALARDASALMRVRLAGNGSARDGEFRAGRRQRLRRRGLEFPLRRGAAAHGADRRDEAVPTLHVMSVRGG